MKIVQRSPLAMALVATALTLSTWAPAEAQAAAGDRTFQLATVTGSQLPVVLEEEDGCREELLSATLALSSTGRWTLTTSERETCGNDVELDEDTDVGMFRITGQTVQFLDIDGDIPETLQASAASAPTDIEVEELSVGTLSGNTLTARLTDGHTVLVFQQ
jgi:hypothetical protein